MFLKYTLDTIIGTPRNYFEWDFVNIFPFILKIEHTRVIMDMKLSSHTFLFHRNINRRENKAQIPLIIHHNEKK